MTSIARMIEVLQNVPEGMQGKTLVLFGPQGQRWTVREDVTQLNVQGDEIHVFVEPQERPSV
jgi:hypothetical protein